MTCKKCGTQFDTQSYKIADGSLVCPSCGTRYRLKAADTSASAPQAAPAAPEWAAKSVPAKRTPKKIDTKKLLIGAGVLAVLAVVIVVLVLLTRGGSSAKYRVDFDATLNEIAKVQNLSAEEIEGAKLELGSNSTALSLFEKQLLLELEDGKVYLSAEIDNFDSLVYANSSRSQYFDTKLRWEDAGGVLVLKLSQELTQAGKDYYKKEAEEWGYTFYEDDYSGESSVSFSYRINGKTLTVTYEGISIAFTRSSGSGGLAGTWDVDLESVRKAILDYADNETAEKIAKVIKLDGADKLSVSLNKNGTIFASARLFAGTYADGSVMLREEVQQVLSEERLNIGIKYEEKGSKIFLTLTPYERGRQSGDAVILVLRKV